MEMSISDNNKSKPNIKIQTQERPLPLFRETLLLIGQAVLIGVCASLVLALLIVFVAPAQADEDIQFKSIDDVGQGSLLTANASGEYTALPLLDTQVEMSISGLVNKTKLNQTFTNSTSDKIEAIYVFPLPENAVVERFKLIVGEKIIEGIIKEKQQAKVIYQKAKSQGKHTALMTQQRPNIFTTKVANIEPNTDISVQISYQQQIDYRSSGFELRFPLVIGPRYTPLDLSYQPPAKVLEENITLASETNTSKLSMQVEQSTQLLNPIAQPEKKVNPVSIQILLDSGFPIEHIDSPSHNIAAIPEQVQENLNNSEKIKKTGIYKINLIEEQVPADRDFVLQWRLKKSDYPRAALFSEPDKNESDSHYINMMLMPPEELFNQEQRLSKEMILVLDTSGSMHGISIQQAKQAVINLLNQMNPGDSFNLIQFNNHYEYLFPIAVPVNPNNIFKAVNYVQNLSADGGTEMAKVMRSALTSEKMTPKSQRKQLRQVIFITDGSISNEDQLFSIIENDLGPSRLFTVGIGTAPNSFFMRKAAEFGRGNFTYISNLSEVESKMQELFKKLQSPLLTKLKITWPKNFDNIEVYPHKLSDLYMGHPLMVTAKVSTTGLAENSKQTVVFEGQSGSTLWRSKLNWDSKNPHPGVSRLWARNKIDALMDDYRNSKAMNSANLLADKKKTLKQEIIDLSIKHHIISQFTAFVAVSKQPATSPNIKAKPRKVSQNMPHGWTGNVLASYPKTATVAPWLERLGISFLVFAFLLWVWRRFSEHSQTDC